MVSHRALKKGESVAGYVRKAVEERMQRDDPPSADPA